MNRPRPAHRRCAVNLLLALVLLALPHPGGPAHGLGAEPVLRKTMQLGLNKTALIDLEEDIGDLVVSGPNIVEAVIRSSRRVFLIGKSAGETNVLFIGKDGRVALMLEIRVERDMAPLADLLRRVIAGSRIEVQVVGGHVLLTGAVAAPADAARAADLAARYVGDSAKVMNMIVAQSGEQVLLKVTVAEINLSAMRRLGVDVKKLRLKGGGAGFSGASETGFGVSGVAVPSAAFDAALAAAQPIAGGAAAVAWRAGGAHLQAAVEALEREGKARLLAEPTLSSVSGETANFLAGGEFPIPVARENENVSVEWRQFGVSLAFTPLVLGEGRISLRIATEVSDLSQDGAVVANGFSIPALSVRRASSTVELPSGGSIVLAGLLSDKLRRSVEGTPGLRDLPVLGPLFQSRDYTLSQTELVIIVTPYLAGAVAPEALRLPGAAGAREWRASVVAAPEAEGPADFGFMRY